MYRASERRKRWIKNPLPLFSCLVIQEPSKSCDKFMQGSSDGSDKEEGRNERKGRSKGRGRGAKKALPFALLAVSCLLKMASTLLSVAAGYGVLQKGTC